MYNSLTKMTQDFNPANFHKAIGQRSISLVGLSGVGKTTIGRCLAKLCRLTFCDSDKEIEICSRLSIKDLFKFYGEAEFRALERRVISRILQQKQIILSGGGGAFIDIHNRNLMKKSGIVIWLRLDEKKLAARLVRRDHRPLVTGKDPLIVVKSLSQQRYPIYDQADFALDCDNYNTEQMTYIIINRIYDYLRVFKCTN